MALSILNNIPSLAAQNQLSISGASLQKTLFRLSSGSRINSGADDAAGLSIANGLQANIAALTQSQQNGANGIGMLQTADGALSQITALLNRAVTLATEASTDTLDTNGANTQAPALDAEYQNILTEIDSINDNTSFNGSTVFSGNATNIYMSPDGTLDMSVSVTVAATDSASLGLTSDLTSATNAKAELANITAAISTVASARGDIGASINQLQANNNVMNTEVQNLTSASNDIMAADIGKAVADMTKFNILQSTGMSALQQSNQSQQSILKLLQ